MSKQYKYDAFISYRHTDLDKFVAEKIHSYLEGFKLPKNVKVSKDVNKTGIKRVFRDKEELTITNNLEDPIVQALKESEYLIVICSPRTKESVWCRTEIEKFIEFHGRNRILTVLIEGEPQDSFPEELLYEMREFCVRIPMLNALRSLNLSNSVAIAVYEVFRQNDFEGLLEEGTPTTFMWEDYRI
ncbi:MAG: TIR domain-containing protein [Clostridia bacterium]|nr:TIR domain-containing protein [Clostridia bacterium]